MTQVVQSYPLSFDDVATIELPVGAQVLAVQSQGNKPHLWALVYTDAPKVIRRFRLLATGEIADGVTGAGYIGTVQMNNGRVVYHVFEEEE